jgi:CAAX prenyl protease-like protein
LQVRNSADVADDAWLTRAHVVPFAVFMAFMLLLQLLVPLMAWDHPEAPWWRRDPAHLVYPVQTLVCLVLLWRYRRAYRFAYSLKWLLISVGFGCIGIGFWLLPTWFYDRWSLQGRTEGWLRWLGVDGRTKGFDPHVFTHPLAVWTAVLLRMLRAVVVVAFVEEIFWRGFLMRYINCPDGDFWREPFGRATWRSYGVVTLLFMLAHSPLDYAGAFVYGSLTWLLCIWSRSLAACVLMHGVANLTMGVFILKTGKYGLW